LAKREQEQLQWVEAQEGGKWVMECRGLTKSRSAALVVFRGVFGFYRWYVLCTFPTHSIKRGHKGLGLAESITTSITGKGLFRTRGSAQEAAINILSVFSTMRCRKWVTETNNRGDEYLRKRSKEWTLRLPCSNPLSVKLFRNDEYAAWLALGLDDIDLPKRSDSRLRLSKGCLAVCVGVCRSFQRRLLLQRAERVYAAI